MSIGNTWLNPTIALCYKLSLSILVMLHSWVLVLLDNWAWYAMMILVVFYTMAAVLRSRPVLSACLFCSFWIGPRASSFSYCSCCSCTRRHGNFALLEVGPWLRAGPLPLWQCGWNFGGVLFITVSGLLSVDAAALASGGQHGSNIGRQQCGASRLCSILKGDSCWL